jgi:hypothetical protein
MGEITGITRPKVVNLADYRAARTARSLPLFDGATEASPAPATVPARPLLTSQIEHRERMLRHLTGG